MKPLPFAFVLLGASFISGARPVAAQDVSDTAGTPTTTQPGTAASGQARMRMWQNLNLTEAQKAQIKQIRTGTTDKKERRQQIMAVLTPEQKAQIKEAVQQRRAQRQG